MNANLSIDRTFLDPRMHLRSPEWNDAEAVAQMIHDACAAEGDPILAVSPEEFTITKGTPRGRIFFPPTLVNMITGLFN